MDRSIALLVGGAPLDEAGRALLGELLAHARLVVAADSGIDHLVALGAAADWVVGDMDSLDRDLRPRHSTDMRWLRYPSDKDESDLELALRKVLALTERELEIVLIGALGGRLDHSLAALQLASLPELSDRRLRFVDGQQQAWLLTGPTELLLEGADGDTVSLLPLSDEAWIEDTAGLRWPLEGEALRFGPSRGLSNEMTLRQARIRLGAGRLLCVHIAADSRILSHS